MAAYKGGSLDRDESAVCRHNLLSQQGFREFQ
jgi:hypothetical protein